MSARILTAYEKGEKEPTPSTITRLAETLTFPEQFLVGPDLDEPPVEGASFRAFSNLTARQRDQALGAGALALAFADWLDERFMLPAVDVPRLQGVDAETAAEAVRAAWGLGQRPIRNMIHLLEAHGGRVFSLAEESREVDAFSFWRRGTPFVFLNTMKSSEHGRMDAAHELGHLVLHWRHQGPRGRDAEQEAKAFGSAFLMPRASVVAEAPRGARLEQIIASKRRWNVSVAALAYRMHTVGLLTEWQHRSLFIEISKKGYRSKEPQTIPRETSQILAKAFKWLRDKGVSKKGVSHALSIPPDELDKIIFGLVLTPIDGSADDLGGSPSDQPDLRLV